MGKACKVNREWQNLPPGEKDYYKALASRKRAVAQAELPRLDAYIEDQGRPQPRAGPWQLSSLGGAFAVHRDAVRDAMVGKTMKGMAMRWDAKCGSKITRLQLSLRLL